MPYIHVGSFSYEGGRELDNEPINMYSGAQVDCNFYFEPLGSYSEPLNLVPNPAIISQQLYFLFYLINLLTA